MCVCVCVCVCVYNNLNTITERRCTNIEWIKQSSDYNFYRNCGDGIEMGKNPTLFECGTLCLNEPSCLTMVFSVIRSGVSKCLGFPFNGYYDRNNERNSPRCVYGYSRKEKEFGTNETRRKFYVQQKICVVT
jgi:hypothetical protein